MALKFKIWICLSKMVKHLIFKNILLHFSIYSTQFFCKASFGRTKICVTNSIWENVENKRINSIYSVLNLLRNCLNIKIINLVKLLNCIWKSDLKLVFAWMECPGSWEPDVWQIQMRREAKWSSALAGKNMIYHPHASQLINVQSKTKFWFA